jgi:hypothetical protein
MAKCVICKKKAGIHKYSEGGEVCSSCAASNFSCPDCGTVFPQEKGDAGNGFCAKCDSEH